MSQGEGGGGHETPQFKITINGTVFEQASAGGVSAIVVERHIEMIGMAQVTLESSSESYGSFSMGQELTVKVGDSDVIFTGIITELRYNVTGNKASMTVVAMDKLIKLVSSHRTEVYLEKKDSEIAQTVMSAAGSVQVDATAFANKYVMQRAESDYFFVKRLAARNNYYVFAKGDGTLQFKKADFANGTEHTVGNGEVQAYDFGWSTAQLPDGVKVFGWDYVTKKQVTNSAAAGDVPVIGGGTNLLSERGDIYGTSKAIVDVFVYSQDAAKAMATSELNRVALNAVRGMAVMMGKGTIEPGHRVKFEGFQTGGNAAGVVISVKHTQDAGGFLTTVYFAGNGKPT